jgi:hypothetical protein
MNARPPSGLLKKTMLIVVVLALNVLPAQATEYKGIRIGQPASELPETLKSGVVISEGEYEGDWFQVSVVNGRVNTFAVIYSAPSLNGTEITRPISLAAALKLHSLQQGNNAPRLGEAVNTKGVRYGIVDLGNQIIYTVDGFESSTIVKQVDYVSSNAPVLGLAEKHMLGQSVVQRLLDQARSFVATSQQDPPPNTPRQNPGESGAPEPFGFKVGMTKTQVVALLGPGSPSKGTADTLEFKTAPTPHPDFETYAVSISSSTGLAQVIAPSKDIQTNVYGEAIKEKFDDVKAALITKYGEPSNSFDFLRAGSIWNEPKDWTMALLKEERTLSAYWKASGGTMIVLEAVGLSNGRAYLRMKYQFSNFSTWLREHDQKQNSVF